jgi:uncharacterized RDD family membrane protein YckC
VLPIRRLIAFAIDAAIIFNIVLVAAFVLDELESAASALFVSVAFVVYFTLTDTRGQSPGKVVTRIKVKRVDGSNLRMYDTALRAVILVGAWPVTEMLVALPRYAHIDVGSFGSFLSVFGPLLVPCSIVADRGRRGFHDRIAETEMSSATAAATTRRSRRAAGAIALGIALTVIVAASVSWSLSRVNSVTDDFADGEVMRNWSKLISGIADLPQYRGHVRSVAITSRKWDAATFKSEFDSDLFPQLSDGDFNGIMDLEIATDLDGLLSTSFQQTVSRHVVTTVNDAGIAFEFHFMTTRRFGPYNLFIGKRLIGLPIHAVNDPGAAGVLFAEPTPFLQGGIAYVGSGWEETEPEP